MNINAAVSPILNKLKTRMALFAGAVVFSAGIMTMTPVASAQIASQVTVPFAFSANQQEFPAGRYGVVMEGYNVVRLVSFASGNSAGIVAHTTRSLTASPKNSLVFLHNDQGYQLTTVRVGQEGVQSDAILRVTSEPEIAPNPNGLTGSR